MPDFAERFLHIDMDAFFVEVERQKDPGLVGLPVVVGGLGRRGVVASASYEARAAGVHSAMPIGEARRLCPHARFVPPDLTSYSEVSHQVFDVFRGFTPLVEGLSVDEAFMDISGLRLHHSSPAAAGEELRLRVRQEVGLPASVGISAIKFISKLASDAAKPDGLLVVDAGKELEFLHPMPVRRLWGVGEATRASLEALAVVTIGDLATVPERVLVSRLGPSLAHHLSQLANGIDKREIEPGGGAKSISVEETYSEDLRSGEAIERALLRLCDRLSSRMRRSGYAGHTVNLKVRFGDFETQSRALTLGEPAETTPALWEAAQVLLSRIDRSNRGVRLLGIGASGLAAADQPRQLSLEKQPRHVAADVVEDVRERFGDAAVFPASLMRQEAKERRDE
ncbi:MAG: DNA polymerase IV [bacterium]|nr:DNA polymerase IV [bacterium]